MSKDSSSQPEAQATEPRVSWNPWLGAGFTLFVFVAAQILAGVLLTVIPLLLGWSTQRTDKWLENSLDAHMLYLGLTTVMVLLPLWQFAKWFKCSPKAIGLRKPKWSDLLYSLLALPAYMALFVLLTVAAKALFPSLDLNQAQDLGFDASYHGIQLVWIAIALVILPPITEEIVFRGFLYGSFKKAMPVIAAAITTSIFFAAGHLLEGGTGGLLYIAAIDTFVLSMVLVYLREKTGGLWASMGLHALKNGIAFVSLFLLHVR